MNNKYRKISSKDLGSFEANHLLKEADWYNNQFHLSGYAGLINDPNGLVYFNGLYYIFMQNCPFSPEHQNKSWILYTTKDFISYTYHGIVLTPSILEDGFGVFSGSAFVWNNELRFYYTGNVKYLESNTRSSYTIEATFDFENKVAFKKPLFKTDEKLFTGHFRDPVVHFNKTNQKFYMLNGAQDLSMNGVLVAYEAESLDTGFKFKNIVELDIFKNYMIECPNFFEIEDKKILLVSPEQETKFKEGSHFVYYQIGDFNKDYSKFISQSSWTKLDWGFDFYAPQVFNNSSRNILIGWNGNSHSEPKITFSNMWSNNLTIPRELKLQNNQVWQNPVEEIKKLRKNEIRLDKNQIIYENGLAEMLFSNHNDDFNFSIKNDKAEEINFDYKKGVLIIDRSLCTQTDDESLPSQINIPIIVEDMRILIDRSCIEIFINKGEKAVSVKFYLMKHNQIVFENIVPKFYQLKGYEINYLNNLWENQEIKINEK